MSAACHPAATAPSVFAEDAPESRRHRLEIEERPIDVEDEEWKVGHETDLRLVGASREAFVSSVDLNSLSVRRLYWARQWACCLMILVDLPAEAAR